MSPDESRAVTQLVKAAEALRDKIDAADDIDDAAYPNLRTWAARTVRALTADAERVRSTAALTVYDWCWTPPASTTGPAEPPAGWWQTDLGRKVARALPTDPAADPSVITTGTAAAILDVTANRVGQLVDDPDQPVQRHSRGHVYRAGVIAYLTRQPHRNDRYRRS